jgi:hypothetical protein
MSGTTSLAELPTSSNLPVQQTQNIQMDINTKIENNVNDRTEDPTIKQKEYNSIISGIQQASASGVTGLPVRDIPQTQTALTQDVQIQPNYVPNGGVTDYIGSVSNNDEIIRRQQQHSNKNESVSYLYEELQTPILISLLYFIFQLPILKNTLFRFVPALFNKDGNPKLTGYVAQSIIFGGLFYTINQVLTYVGDYQ